LCRMAYHHMSEICKCPTCLRTCKVPSTCAYGFAVDCYTIHTVASVWSPLASANRSDQGSVCSFQWRIPQWTPQAECTPA
jgi:hypothetical protein